MSDLATPRSRLLVSVRSATEALAALAGGADLIDVKEPTRGSLGRADADTIAEVVRAVAGRRPVSAALGELAEWQEAPSPSGLAFVKWGLAGCDANWPSAFERACLSCDPSPQPVVVAYADWQRAGAPSVQDVSDFACRTRRCLLIDTFAKDGSTLVDWLPVPRLTALCQRFREANIPIALAGALSLRAIEALLPLQPDWFAVRGAACAHGQRAGSIDPARVRALHQLLQRPTFD